MPTVLGRKKGFPTGQFDWDGTRLVRTYEDLWEVQADTETQGPFTIVNSLNIPIGYPFFDDVFALAKRVGPAKRTEENRLIWNIPIHYTTQFSTEDAEDAGKRPDLRRLKKRWSYETMQVPFTKDAITVDKAVANSAGEPIEATTEIVIPILTVEKFKPFFDPDEILEYANHTNSQPFYGAPAKTALLQGIEAEDVEGAEIYEGTIYHRLRYVVKFKIPISEENKGWVERYVDVGTVFKSGSTLKPYLSDIDPTTGKRERITGPLDGSGGKLSVGNPLVVLQFNKHAEANLNDLALGP